ncbi:hypothetical protein SCALIN_C05_0053 [Candidatus Scalindua japonica]|uniref:Uncharacterized protein n=1 Tax=Candidatus Scalindua japonica TaxID=1284222 RepID=A0A286TVN4_9BACT|nr:hypothetical protein [Candidatus Scalindua japonica]GAX59968.1 hypothetical protein SCALIN_C05_0053 [Candidatus Scalindua japonica]
MVVKKISFVLVVLAIAIMGTAIPPALAADDAASIARRDKMINALKSECAVKVGAKKKAASTVPETAEATTDIKTVITEKVEELKAETDSEAEPVVTETISEVKDAAEAASEHGTEAAEKVKAEITC